MSSAIDGIYDAIAAETVSDGANDIAALDADELPKGLHSIQTPVRLLTPIDPLLSENARSNSAFAAQAGSGMYEIRWSIFDVLYHTPVNQAIGPKALAKKLLAYIADYYDMISDTDTRLSLPDNCSIESSSHLATMLEYPLDSDHWFFAVRTELIIREVVC